jgi:hypothetical protein
MYNLLHENVYNINFLIEYVCFIFVNRSNEQIVNKLLSNDDILLSIIL